MKIKFKALDYRLKSDGDTEVILTANKSQNHLIEQLFNKLKGIDRLTAEIKRETQKRSLDANSFYWLLLTELACILKTSNDELHSIMIKRYSDTYLIPLLPEQKPEQIFTYFDFYRNTVLNGKDAVYYKVYVGSSQMDTKQFSRLLDGLISECQEAGVQTMTREEIERLEGYELDGRRV